MRRVDNPLRVPAAERPCPRCGAERTCVDHESTEGMELIPAEGIVRRDLREKLACMPGALVRSHWYQGCGEWQVRATARGADAGQQDRPRELRGFSVVTPILDGMGDSSQVGRRATSHTRARRRTGSAAQPRSAR